MFERLLAHTLRRRAQTMPVVAVVGPRQSGKTTLVRELFGGHLYLSLERPDVRAEALEDPLGFLGQAADGMILDEVQRAPELLSYIQGIVDDEDRPGHFILTGSQNLLLMEGISQTLAGRIALLRLLPLSLNELCSRPPVEVSELNVVEAPPPPIDRELWETVWSGLYPRIHDKALHASEWLGDYFRTYVERDLREVLRVMDLDRFESFVRLLAARTGQELNLNGLAADAGISQPTAKQWLTALRVGFIVTLLQPYHENYRKRLRRRPKLHFLDTGLACYLLGIRSPDQLRRHPLRGALFESFVVGELTKGFEHQGREAPLYHWRDATGHEIDVLIDLGERQIPVEIKSGRTVAADALDNLRWWTGLKVNPNTGGLLVYGGDHARMRSGFAIRPWFLG